MSAGKPPTARDAVTARAILLDGVASDIDVVEILGELAPLHPRSNTFPGEILLRLAADALEWAQVDRAHPVDLEGTRERFLAEVDLLDEVAWWQTDDFWRYAAYAAIAYIRIVADRAGVPAAQVCRGLAREHPPPTRMTATCAHIGAVRNGSMEGAAAKPGYSNGNSSRPRSRTPSTSPPWRTRRPANGRAD